VIRSQSFTNNNISWRFAYFFIVFVVFFAGSVLQSATAAAQPAESPVIALSGSTERVVLSKNIRYLKDESYELGIKQVASEAMAGQFFEISQDRANFSFSDAAYWLNFTLATGSSYGDETRKWWLKADYPLLDRVDVFIRNPATGRIRHLELGDDRPIANNGLFIPFAAFSVDLAPDERRELFIRVETSSSKQLGVQVFSSAALAQSLLEYSLFSGAFYGVMFIMALYNLFVFVSIRDNAYLFYVLGIVSYIVLQGSLEGLPWLFSISENPVWFDRALPIMMNTTWICMLFFSRSFLRTRVEEPFIDRIIVFLIITAFWFAGLSFWADYSTSIAIATRASFLFSIVMAAIGVMLWRRGNRLARYYTAAWCVNVAGVLIYIQHAFGTWDYNVFVAHGLQIGAFCNVLLLALALADKINMQKHETESARRKALTAKKEAQLANEKAQEHLARFQQLYENASEGIFQCTLDGRFISVNPSLAKTFGYASPEEMVEQITDIASECYIDPSDRHNFERALIEKGRIVDAEHVYRGKDGSTFWGSSSAHVAYDEEGKPAYLEGSLVDITERREKEHAQREREAAQASAQAKSDFLANMSHEIRTPMNAIIGFSDLVLRTDLNERQRDYLQKIGQASRSLLGIINDILDFSKIEAGKLDLETTPFNLTDVANDLADMLSQKSNEKNLELSVSYNHEVPTALIGDPLRLGQVLINLTNNAIKFTDEGEVQLRIKKVSEADGRVCLSFAVTDTGIGIAQEKIDTLFDPFTQADGSTTRQYGGTGLGLSISKQMVEMMGGDMGAESQAGRGSTFFFTAWFDMPDGTAQNGIYDSSPLAGKKVLLLDERDAGLDAIITIVRSSGGTVTVIHPDQRLGETLQVEGGVHDFDLVLIDRNLAAAGTLDAALMVRNTPALAEVPVAPLLQPHEENLLEQCWALGYLPIIKPVTPFSLVRQISDILGLDSTASPDQQDVAENEEALLEVIAGAEVLLVEDTPFNQEIATEFFNQANVNVTIAQNGAEALGQLEKGRFDLVFMDCQMPVMDGFEATKRIREKPEIADTVVIAMTANAMKGDREKCIAAGMDDYLSKPIAREALYRTMARWLNGETRPQRIYSASPEVAEEPVAESQQAPVKVFDFELALQRAGDNEDLLEELISRFEQENFDVVDRILDALDADDRETAHRLAHTVKGMAASLAGVEVEHTAGILEEALATGAVSTQVERHVCNLDTALTRLLNELKSEQGEYQ
jgi:PAS domain S-box-containing protein